MCCICTCTCDWSFCKHVFLPRCKYHRTFTYVISEMLPVHFESHTHSVLPLLVAMSCWIKHCLTYWMSLWGEKKKKKKDKSCPRSLAATAPVHRFILSHGRSVYGRGVAMLLWWRDIGWTVEKRDAPRWICTTVVNAGGGANNLGAAVCVTLKIGVHMRHKENNSCLLCKRAGEIMTKGNGQNKGHRITTFLVGAFW